MILPLTKKEAQQLDSAGTVMQKLTKEEWRNNRPGFRREFYKFLVDCANLGTDANCEDYENRPRVCREFEMGSFTCDAAQYKFERDQQVVTDLPMPTVPTRVS